MTTADMLDNDDVRELLEFLAHDNRQGDAVFEEAEAGQEAGGAHRKVSNGYFERFCDRVESTLADKELGRVEPICIVDFKFRDHGGLNLPERDGLLERAYCFIDRRDAEETERLVVVHAHTMCKWEEAKSAHPRDRAKKITSVNVRHANKLERGGLYKQEYGAESLGVLPVNHDLRRGWRDTFKAARSSELEWSWGDCSSFPTGEEGSQKAYSRVRKVIQLGESLFDSYVENQVWTESNHGPYEFNKIITIFADDVAAEAGASAKRGPTEASSAAAEPCRGGSAAAREGIVVAMARHKKVVEPAAGGVGGASQIQAVAEWTEPDWDGLKLDEPDPAPWPFKILFVGVNNDVKPDLCLRDELKAIQAALDKGFNRASTDRPVLKQIAYSEWKDVMQEIRDERPSMLHFGCHSERETGLQLYGQTVQPAIMLPAIREWNECARRNGWEHIRVIVVNACDSDVHAKALNDCVDFTIGHKEGVHDKDAINFSGTFYDCIFKGMRFSGSFQSARSESSSGYRIYAKKDPRSFFLQNFVNTGRLQAGSKRACNSDNFQAASASKVPRTQGGGSTTLGKRDSSIECDEGGGSSSRKRIKQDSMLPSAPEVSHVSATGGGNGGAAVHQNHASGEGSSSDAKKPKQDSTSASAAGGLGWPAAASAGEGAGQGGRVGGGGGGLGGDGGEVVEADGSGGAGGGPRVFLGYRVDSDRDLADRLCDKLKLKGINVWCDFRSLPHGKPWEESFVDGLCSSDVFVPVMSKAALAPFATLTPESKCDNVLFEHQLALELKMRGQLHLIFPVLVGELRHDEELGEMYGDFFKGNGMPSCPEVMVGSVEAKLKEHLQRMGKGAPQLPDNKRKVNGTLKAITEHQGVSLKGIKLHAVEHVVDEILQLVDPEVLLREQRAAARVVSSRFPSPAPTDLSGASTTPGTPQSPQSPEVIFTHWGSRVQNFRDYMKEFIQGFLPEAREPRKWNLCELLLVAFMRNNVAPSREDEIEENLEVWQEKCKYLDANLVDCFSELMLSWKPSVFETMDYQWTESSRPNLTSIFAINWMVQHSRLVQAKKDEWAKKVVKDWFDSGNTDSADIFLDRAEEFLKRKATDKSWGAKILGPAIEVSSYVVFFRADALAALLLREYCDLQRYRALSAHAKMREDLPVLVPEVAQKPPCALPIPITFMVSSSEWSLSLSESEEVSQAHVSEIAGRLRRIACLPTEMLEDSECTLDKLAFVDWEPLPADRMKAEQSEGPSAGSALSPGTDAQLQSLFSDQIRAVNDYLEDFKKRFGRYEDSASGEELATEEEAISVEADIDEGGTREALPQEVRGDATGAHAHAASQDPDSRQKTIQEMEASRRNGAEGEEERRIFLRRMGYETGKDTGTSTQSEHSGVKTIASAQRLLHRLVKGHFMCLIGPPASGKTVMMYQVACAAAAVVRKCANEPPSIPPRIPVFMRAAELPRLVAQDSQGVESLEKLIELHIRDRYSNTKVADLLMEFVRLRRVLVIIDGLDEAAGYRGEIERLVDMAAADQDISLMISTRDYAFQTSRMEHRLGDFKTLKILPLDEQRRNRLIGQRLPDRQEAVEFSRQLAAVTTLTPELATSPFLIALMIEVFKRDGNHQIPSKRTDLYDRQVDCSLVRLMSFRHLVAPCARSASLRYMAAHMIFHDKDLYQDANRDPLALEALKIGLRASKDAVDTDSVGPRDVVSLRQFLEVLAFECQMQLEIRDFKWTEISAKVQARWEQLQESSVSMEMVSRYVLDLSSVGLLSRVGEGEYRFSHLTLQEYLAAACAVRLFNLRELDLPQLVGHFKPLHSHWKLQVLQFTACMLREEAFPEFCQVFLEMDDGSGVCCELVQDFLRERGPSEAVERMLRDQMQKIRGTDLLLAGLCHPCPEMRSLVLSEMSQFRVPPNPFADESVPKLKEIAEDTSCAWHTRAAAMLSLAQIAQMKHCSRSDRAETIRWMLKMLQSESDELENVHFALVKALGTVLKEGGQSAAGGGIMLLREDESVLSQPGLRESVSVANALSDLKVYSAGIVDWLEGGPSPIAQGRWPIRHVHFLCENVAASNDSQRASRLVNSLFHRLHSSSFQMSEQALLFTGLRAVHALVAADGWSQVLPFLESGDAEQRTRVLEAAVDIKVRFEGEDATGRLARCLLLEMEPTRAHERSETLLLYVHEKEAEKYRYSSLRLRESSDLFVFLVNIMGQSTGDSQQVVSRYLTDIAKPAIGEEEMEDRIQGQRRACAAAEASGRVGKRRIRTWSLPDGSELVPEEMSCESYLSWDRIADAVEDGEELRPVFEEAGAECGPDEKAGREGAGQGEAKRRRVEHGQGAAAVSGSPEGGARDEGKEGNSAETDAIASSIDEQLREFLPGILDQKDSGTATDVCASYCAARLWTSSGLVQEPQAEKIATWLALWKDEPARVAKTLEDLKHLREPWMQGREGTDGKWERQVLEALQLGTLGRFIFAMLLQYVRMREPSSALEGVTLLSETIRQWDAETDEKRLEQRFLLKEFCIGRRNEHVPSWSGAVTQMRTQQVMHFASLDVKAFAEVGEQVQLVLQGSDKDVFGNHIGVPLSASAKADLLAILFEGVWSHEGRESPLNLSQPIVTEGGLVVAELRLMLAGRHIFRIKSAGQELTASIEITAGLPESLRLLSEGKPHVLQQRRWHSKIELLNRQTCVANFSGQEVSVELVPTGGGSARSYPLQIEAITCESSIQGCSLSDVESSTMVQVLAIFLPETDDAPPAGTYSLRVKRATDGCELSCEPSTIHLDLPLDPAAWTSQDLAQSLRLEGLLASTSTEPLKDEFNKEIDGKVLVQRGAQTGWILLRDSLFLGRRFLNWQEKDSVEAHIQKFAKSLFERHTLAGLGKGKYRSSVAKSISEFDLNLEPVSFYTGGCSEIFRGHYEGRPVAVKIPMVRNRGLEVCDDTARMMEEVERELCVTRACRHPHVVQLFGLMVGPGRIGIVMELCDTSLAKRIQERSAAINWAETVRLLMDGTAGLGFIHKQKKTTHGDLKPDNLLIQEGRLKVADFGLATVRDSVRCYMAPEKMLGRFSDQPSADVWSFGCVIANVATGRSPFFEDKSEEALLVSLRQKKPVYDKAHVLPGCPQKLLELIDRCTHYDATMRPSMTDIERELRMVLQSIQSQDGFGLPALWQERGFLLNSPEQLLECSAGSRDYDLIKARLEQEMGNSPTVLKVEMNANVDLLRRYAWERKKVAEENGGDANEVWLWHATSSNVAEKTILKEGFDLNRCGLNFEYYGAGIHLAPDCKLSNRYAAKSETRSMLLVRVACGKIFERTPLHLSPEYQAFLQELGSQQVTTEHRKKLQQDKTRELLRMPKNRSCPNGYNSQLGVDVSGSRKSKTEVVVNKNFQVYPAYRVTYRPGGALPDPLSRAGKDALKTFDEYKASDFHRQAQNVLL